MSVREQKLNKLLNLFLNNEIVSTDKIKEYLNLGDRSIKYYIKEIRSLGYKIVSMNKAYKLISDEYSSGIFLSPQDVRILKILIIISQNNGFLNKKDLTKKVISSLCDDETISEKTIERAINLCRQKGLIFTDENNHFRLSITTDSIHITDDDEIFKFIERSELYKSYTAFPDQISKIKDKIIEQTGYDDLEYNIYSIGRPYKSNDNLQNIIMQLELNEYRRKALEIRYATKDGERTVIIQVATFLYNSDIDRSYLIGMVDNKIFFIITRSILSIRKTDQLNRYYKNKKILNTLDLMFGASLDGPYNVKVEFQDIFNIREKIERIHDNRKHSRIACADNKIIYEDTIYGIYDFARFLRGFGLACKVLEPKELRDIMKNTYEKILHNYGVLGYEK